MNFTAENFLHLKKDKIVLFCLQNINFLYIIDYELAAKVLDDLVDLELEI
jgi:hypothetical protein